MLYEILGLLFEVFFLAVGVYMYLFSRGFFKAKTKAAEARAEQFRQQNGWWLRLLSIALIAIMSFNLALHVYQLVS